MQGEEVLSSWELTLPCTPRINSHYALVCFCCDSDHTEGSCGDWAILLSRNPPKVMTSPRGESVRLAANQSKETQGNLRELQ